MQHEILGHVKQDDDGDGLALISYDEQSIEVRIIEDGIGYEAAVEIAATVVRQIERLDGVAKKAAAEGLTETYNGGWNEYDETQEDGTTKTVSNPELTQQEFIEKLTLQAVHITGDMIEFFYDDEKMFWGHHLVVTAMDGLSFKDLEADLFG